MTEAPQAKPIEDVRDISAITYGFMASKALFAALDFDLFTHIARGADSVIGLAKATGVSENRLLTLLTALKSLGLIVEREGRFANAPATAKFLVAGAPGEDGDVPASHRAPDIGHEDYVMPGRPVRGDGVACQMRDAVGQSGLPRISLGRLHGLGKIENGRLELWVCGAECERVGAASAAYVEEALVVAE